MVCTGEETHQDRSMREKSGHQDRGYSADVAESNSLCLNKDTAELDDESCETDVSGAVEEQRPTHVVRDPKHLRLLAFASRHLA